MSALHLMIFFFCVAAGINFILYYNICISIIIYLLLLYLGEIINDNIPNFS